MANLIDSYATSNVNTVTSVYGATGLPEASQSFTGNGSDIGSCVFNLTPTGSPTGNCYAKVYAHSGTFGTSSVPTGAVLATSDAIVASTATGDVTFTFSGVNQITVSNATKYCLAFEYSVDTGGFPRMDIGVDTTTPSHSGNAAYLQSGTWNAQASVDIPFLLYDNISSSPHSRLSILGVG